MTFRTALEHPTCLAEYYKIIIAVILIYGILLIVYIILYKYKIMKLLSFPIKLLIIIVRIIVCWPCKIGRKKKHQSLKILTLCSFIVITICCDETRTLISKQHQCITQNNIIIHCTLDNITIF